MSKINIDDSLCTGCGLCVSNCPDVFEIGDDNIAHVVAVKSINCNVKDVAEQCPVSAIKLL
jgi:ferredoxin